MQTEISIQLINKCQAGDGKAQRELYDLLFDYMKGICTRYLYYSADLKDVLQEVFIQLFKCVRQYDTKRASFKTWATRIAINHCFKYNKSYKKCSTEELIPGEHTPTVNPEVLDRLDYEELLDWMRSMPSDYYTVFNLYVVDDFSHDEIAEILNISTASSRKRLSRARKWLKKNVNSNYLVRMSK